MLKLEGYAVSSYDAAFEPTTFLVDLRREDGQTVLDVEDLNSGRRFVISTKLHIKEQRSDGK